MNELRAFLDLAEEDRRRRGILHTPAEILQQPDAWEETCAKIIDQSDALKAFLGRAGVASIPGVTVYLLGAGTSEYIGNTTANLLRRRLGTTVISLPTTTFITNPRNWIFDGGSYLFVHFARSGDSPESLASYELARLLSPTAFHLVITCNATGQLAKGIQSDDQAYLLTLPGKTNDQSLVMTSSFSSMVAAATALSYLEDLEEYQARIRDAADAVRRLFESDTANIRSFAEAHGSRIQFLGSGNILGTMQECRLKVLEMTEGRIAANVDTYLGLRHGPRVFVDNDCTVAASVSGDDYQRHYERDLLTELGSKGQTKGMLIVSDDSLPGFESAAHWTVRLHAGSGRLPEDFRPLTDVVVGQLVGLFSSLSLGLKPDNPSEDGIISRVVSGVNIYPYPSGSPSNHVSKEGEAK